MSPKSHSFQPVAASQLKARVPLGGNVKVWHASFGGKDYYRLRHFPLLPNASKVLGREFSVQPYSMGGFVLVNGTEFRDQPAIATSIHRQVPDSFTACNHAFLART
jgi:hypothetical protein